MTIEDRQSSDLEEHQGQNSLEEARRLIDSGGDFSWARITRKIGAERAVNLLEDLFMNHGNTETGRAQVVKRISDDIFDDGYNEGYGELFQKFISQIDLVDVAKHDRSRRLLEILRYLIYSIYELMDEEEYRGRKGDYIERLRSLTGKKDNNYGSRLDTSML